MADRDERESEPDASRPPEPVSTARDVLTPYVVVLLVGLVIAVGVLAYVALYRDEILAILTQSPT